MLGELWGGVRMALRRWRRMLALGAMVAVGCAVLALVLSDVLVQAAVLGGGQELRNRHAVIFNPFYETSGVSQVDDRVVMQLVEDVASAHAYTAIIQNVQVDNPDFADGNRTVILFGDLADEIFSGLGLCDPAPCGMRGSALAGQRLEPIVFAGATIPVDDILRPSATYFDVNLGAVPLDDRIVLRLPAESLLLVDAIEREEALTRAVMVDVSAERIEAFVAGSRAGGLSLIPHDVAVSQPQRLANIITISAMYVAGMIAFLGLVLAAFASAAESTIREHVRDFMIRRMHGARIWHVFARIGSFAAVVVLIPPLVPLQFLRNVGEPFSDGANIVLGLVVAIFVAMVAHLGLRLNNRELRGR